MSPVGDLQVAANRDNFFSGPFQVYVEDNHLNVGRHDNQSWLMSMNLFKEQTIA